jgi:putative transposase
MARPLRIEFPGALYHVMSRGNDRCRIVRDDVDRVKRLDWLRKTVDIHGWRLHAFVLMNNHEHLFVETPEANLSAGMQHLNGSYTSYFNRRHGRVGHLLQGRFKAHLVEDEGYFLEVSRYIHLNPVRARMVDRPEAYRFSSYPGYVRSARSVPWVCYGRVLGEFGSRSSSARRAYGRFVRQGIEQPPDRPFAAALGGLLLGSEKFIDRMRDVLDQRPADAAIPALAPLRSRPPLDRIVAVVCEHFGDDSGQWRPGRRVDGIGRAAVAYLARRHFGYTAGEVAAELGYRGHGSVHNAVRRIETGGAKLKKTLSKMLRNLH